MQIDRVVEAILFYRGEPVAYSELCKMIKIKDKELAEAVKILRERLVNSGLTLIETKDALALGTHGDISEIISKLRKEEFTKDLSKASLETLSVILYGDMITRADIDFIRGVNSSFILRNLLIRGLVERRTHPTDSRKIVYVASSELLAFLGVSRANELPDYDIVRQKMQSVEEGKKNELAKENEAFAQAE